MIGYGVREVSDGLLGPYKAFGFYSESPGMQVRCHGQKPI